MALKKHGSTLITTVVLISLIGVVGSSILSLSISEYRLRISDSEKLHNLYASDSGLDVAYDLMVANFDMAGNFAKFKVEQLKNGKLSDSNANVEKYNKLLEEQEALSANSANLSAKEFSKKQEELQEEINKVINAEFKRSFKLFLFGKEYSNNYGNELVPDQLINSITNMSYIVNMNKTGTSDGESLDPLVDEISQANFYINEISLPTQPEITVEVSTNDTDKSEEKDEDYNREQKFTISITSSFYTTDELTNSTTNKKEIEAKYTVSIPNYTDISFRTQESATSNLIGFDDKGLTIFGNMQVKDMQKNELTIDGDIFVQGDMDKNLLKSNGELYETYGNILGETSESVVTSDVSTTHITEKYQGGITLGSTAGKTTITINGNLITRNTLNISQNVALNVSQNIYANNVYAGLPNGGSGNKVELNMSDNTDMVLNNDLTLKATNSTLNISNFYGINDKNDTTSDNKEQRSSSIIVNNKEDEDSSNIVIDKEAYIMGVAFVDTANSFQTGESTAVRGNYEAYEEDGEISDLEDDGNLDSKVAQFVEYWNASDNLNNLRDGGIVFNSGSDIHSVGATIVNGSVKDSNIIVEDLENEVADKQKEYAVNVYNLGESLSSENEKLKLYQNPISAATLKLNYFNIDNIDDANNNVKFSNEGCIGLFNKNNDITIVIKGKNPTSEKYNDASKYNVIDGTNLSAFIATSGNVIIDGQVNFSGNIIAGGNLIVMGSNDKTITYDASVCEKLQNFKPELFEKVFKVSTTSDTSTSTSEGTLKVNYDLDKFIKQTIWQVKKN